MNTLNLANNKVDGESTLAASEWNTLVTGVNTLITEVNNLPTPSETPEQPASSDSHIVFDSTGKHNLTIQTTAADQYEKNGEMKGGKINIEPISDLQVKAGDDIILYSHHRPVDKQDEVSVKVTDGDDVPVKLQLNAAEMTLTTKDKTGDDANVFDINVNSEKNTKGYLKVRAQAIDLRSESHGGIALQPKGNDGQNHMNKIKFEHGGGDGLEFGTFNTEKTSIFTDEYRFNREGVWKMATREKEVSDKYDVSDETTHYKYTKQADDFYDVIAQDDEQCKTKDIIKTAFALNGAKDRHTKLTNKGAIEIATNDTYTIHIESTTAETVTISTIAKVTSEFDTVTEGQVFNEGDFNTLPTASTVYTNGTQYFSFVLVPANDIKIDSGAGLKLGGILDFGSSFNFGETDNGIEVQYKLTKKNATKDCGILKVVGVNNNTSTALVVPNVVNASDGTIGNVTVAAGETATITSCSILDIINLVNYMKSQGQGPWANNL